MPAEKFLWAVEFAAIQPLIDRAVAAGITVIALRTDTDVAGAIPLAHQANLKVFGWRWPTANTIGAGKEAARAARLYTQGMDGYIVDPEGDPGKSWDWDQPNLDQVAAGFCQKVKAAGPGKPFGVTSHFLAAKPFPNLPWSTFVGFADLLLPQSYWRTEGGAVKPGEPVKNYDLGLAAWSKLTNDPSKISPMAGELASVTPAEILAYGQHAIAQGRSRHFYTYEPTLSDAIWDAIQQS